VRDISLINLAKNGDGTAWRELVETHQESMFRLAYLILGDADEAKDATQEAFIRAYRAFDRFDISRPVRPWLLSIAANTAKNRKRSLGRYFKSISELFTTEPKASTTTEALYSKSIRALDLHHAIERLENIDQQIIYMRYFMNLSVRETSYALSIAEGTVKSRHHRAIKRLGTIIESEFPELKEIRDGRSSI
jgi:RNA polymerase sigma-70 factor, ECF subfamily